MLPDHAPSVVRLDAAAPASATSPTSTSRSAAPRAPPTSPSAPRSPPPSSRRDDIRYVLFHRDPTFFKDNALLYAKLGDLLEIRAASSTAIQARIRREMSAFPEDEPPLADTELHLDETELRRRYHLEDAPPPTSRPTRAA
jgi:hypothetical protein